MGGYQYYEFLAVDRPLSAQETATLRGLSTRAQISSTSLVNTYHWGDFRGDPRVLVERYFDAFLYLAEWGSRELMIRLPATILPPALAEAYCGDDAATSWAAGRHTVLHYSSDTDDPEDFDEDAENWLVSIIPARAELAAGDNRLLYLGWLLAAQLGGLDDEEVEPAVPAGLRELSGPLKRFAEFLRLDDDLIEVASRASDDLEVAKATKADLLRWVGTLPGRQKDDLLVQAMRGQRPQLRVELMRRFGAESRRGAESSQGAESRRNAESRRGAESSQGVAVVGDDEARRTVGDLLYAADTLRLERERAAAERRERDRVRREKAAAEAVAARREALAAEGDEAWARVARLIETKKPADYAAAIAILSDLQAINRDEGRSAAFTDRVRQVREQHSRKPGLLARLDRAGL